MKIRKLYSLIGWGALFIALYWLSARNYLLFHSIAELFTIVIAWGIFVIAWSSRERLDNHYVFFLGIASLFVGFLDLIHTLAYKGMGVFHGYDANLPTQLWLAARYTQGFSLLLALPFLYRRLKPASALLAFSATTSVLLASIFYWKIFPDAFIEGTGLTPFKKDSEYLISLILLISGLLLLRNRRAFDTTVLHKILGFIGVLIISELCFTLYTDVYGLFNMFGHYAQILSFYLLYEAVVETGLAQPQRLLFRNLKQSEEALQKTRDELEIRVQERTAELASVNEDLENQIALYWRAELRFKELFESIADAVLVSDPTGMILMANAQAEKLFGYARDELVGKPFTLLVPERYRAIHDGRCATFSKETAVRAMGYCSGCAALRRDGTEFAVEITMSSLEAEEAPVIISSIRDMTERTRLEADLRRLNQELERRVSERTAQLELANKELEAFSYSISHDLRAPLRSIDGFSRIIAEEYGSKLPPEAEHYFDLMRGSVREMSLLIDALLSFSRLGRAALKKNKVLPEKLARDALAELSADRQGRHVEITMADLPPCDADPLLLKVVFVNLLSNALKFTRQREKPHIEIGSLRDKDEIIYYVRDNGVGFDMKYAYKLFGVFQRLHSEKEYEGTGVGLATVRRIVSRHGGRIWAEAEVGIGATFYWTLGKTTDSEEIDSSDSQGVTRPTAEDVLTHSTRER